MFKVTTNDSGEINKQNGPRSSEIDVIKVSQQSFQLIVIGHRTSKCPASVNKARSGNCKIFVIDKLGQSF